jgi:hypothetical protein
VYPAFLDIEASGLGNTSYPIEVAWSDSRATVHTYLIRPDENWTSWDMEAERIHGISRDELHDRGLSPAEVCQRIRTSISGVTAYSDAPELERFWMNRLFQAGEGGNSPILVLGVSQIPEIRTICYERGLYNRLKEQAIEAEGKIHRAASDVRILMSVFKGAKAHPRNQKSEQDAPSNGG